MEQVPDTSIVNLHRASRSPLAIDRLEGQAWRIREGASEAEQLSVRDLLRVGETVAVAPGGVVEAGPLQLRGGFRGQAHALVKAGAFRPSPNRTDVPRLLLQLAQIEEQMTSFGEDPLAVREGPETPFERAASAEFARNNLVLMAARELPESVAQEQAAVCIFVNEETAFVAVSELSVAKLRAVMEALQRPVNPHMVEPQVLDELLERVYRRPH